MVISRAVGILLAATVASASAITQVERDIATATPTNAASKCGAAVPSRTFFLQVVPSSGPLDRLYAAIADTDTARGEPFHQGIDHIILSSNPKRATPFTLSDTCNLDSFTKSDKEFYGLGGDYPGFSASEGHAIEASKSQYDFLEQQSPPFKPYSCLIQKRALVCTDPVTKGSTWVDCPGDPVGIFLNKTVDRDFYGNKCYSFSLTTLASRPTPT